MARAAVNFDAPDLAKQIEQLSQSELDSLPFGVILIDREGGILFYSEAEARQSGYREPVVGQNLFTLCKRFGSDDFRGRIARALEKGAVDIEFGWIGDYGDPKRDLRIRIQDSSRHGFWIFIQRDPR